MKKSNNYSEWSIYFFLGGFLFLFLFKDKLDLTSEFWPYGILAISLIMWLKGES